MRRPAFPPSPFATDAPAGGNHPLPPLLVFILLAWAIGLAWTWPRLLLAAAGVAVLLLLPRPTRRPLVLMLRFIPLLVVVLLIHMLPWRGFGEGLPWTFDGAGWRHGLPAMARFALWILLSAGTLERISPAGLMARLPSRPRLARIALLPVLAVGFLDLFLREAFLLERAWRSRIARPARRPSAAEWPALILPLFRAMLSRADTLAEALAVRRFPNAWAGGEEPRLHAGTLLGPGLAAVLLALIYLAPWEAAV